MKVFRYARPFFFRQQLRHLHLHEYQSKELLAKYDIATQPFRVGTTPHELVIGAKQLNAAFLEKESNGGSQKENSCSVPSSQTQPYEWVLKAQVLAGGRGKGHFKESGLQGGVQLTNDINAISRISQQMLHNHLITIQTPPEGVLVHRVMVAEAVSIVKESYFAILMDRGAQGPILLASPMGGVDIEAVARDHPDKLLIERIDIRRGVSKEQAAKVAAFLGFSTAIEQQQAAAQIERLYRLFVDVDATQVEINPLALTSQGRVLCIDAKMQFDDNAAFRHADLFELQDPTEQDPRELLAAKHNLNYIGLQGSIGCLVNGAGLAMATMDMIHLCGGSPANFLDVGGNATKAQVTEAFKLLNSDPSVKVIMVNIFGGIMKCDTIAAGIVDAVREIGLKLPLVVRLSGTNVQLGMRILKDSGLSIILAEDMEAAAILATKAAH